MFTKNPWRVCDCRAVADLTSLKLGVKALAVSMPPLLAEA